MSMSKLISLKKVKLTSLLQKQKKENTNMEWGKTRKNTKSLATTATGVVYEYRYIHIVHIERHILHT